jgi:CRP-like cAMP-binding protein
MDSEARNMDGFKKFITSYKTGEMVYKAGDDQAAFYIINKGRILVRSTVPPRELTVLSKGDFFGEESLKEDQKALLTIEVIEDADIIRIPYPDLVDMMKKSPDISHKILKKLADKQNRITETLLKMASVPAPTPIKETPPQDDMPPVNRPEEITSEKLDPNIKAYLIIQRSNRIVQLIKAKTTIGRRDYTTGFVPDVDLTKEDEEKYISRKHASVLYIDGRFYVTEETGAINGTFKNGNKLETGVKYELNNEDEITLCHLNVAFRY